MDVKALEQHDGLTDNAGALPGGQLIDGLVEELLQGHRVPKNGRTSLWLARMTLAGMGLAIACMLPVQSQYPEMQRAQ